MYCRQAVIHSWGVFHELTHMAVRDRWRTYRRPWRRDSWRVLVRRSRQWVIGGFVVRNPSKLRIGMALPIAYSVIGAVSPRDIFWLAGPRKHVSPLLPLANIM